MSEPDTIDRYEIQKALGQGAMGSIFAAWDPKLHRDVAIKVVSEELSQDSKARERFHREARAIASLRHPNIVEIYDYSGEESPLLFLVMEKLDGDDIFNLVNDHGPMPEPCVAAIGHELCLALQVAHDAGIIHRDIKPENVFLNASGRVILTDFGVVKAIRQGTAVEGFAKKTEIIGTPGFMAPELMMNRTLGPRTDLFALGALLYNIATGELPFSGNSPVEIFHASVSGNFDDPRNFDPTLSHELCNVFDGCLKPKPKRRFRSAEQLRKLLKLVLEMNGVSDLRDDLRDYMQDQKAYAQMCRRRAIGYLLQQAKLSVKDKQNKRVHEIRERLNVLDPDNREMQTISGVHPDVDDDKTVRTSERFQDFASRSVGLWLYVVGGVFAGAALILAGYTLLRNNPSEAEPTPPPPEIVTPVTETPANKPPPNPQEKAKAVKPISNQPSKSTPSRPKQPLQQKTGTLAIALKGGEATIYVDNKRVSKKTKWKAKLAAGTHLVEVRARKKRIKKKIVLSKNGFVTLIVDVKRGRVLVR